MCAVLQASRRVSTATRRAMVLGANVRAPLCSALNVLGGSEELNATLLLPTRTLYGNPCRTS